MILEELKVEAEKLGYKLVEINKKKYISLLPCPVCGKKRTEEWIMNDVDHDVYFRVCSYCGFDGYFSKTIKGSRAAWNEAVKVYLESHKNKED